MYIVYANILVSEECFLEITDTSFPNLLYDIRNTLNINGAMMMLVELRKRAGCV